MKLNFKFKNLLKVAFALTITVTVALTVNYVDDVFIDKHRESDNQITLDIDYSQDSVRVETTIIEYEQLPIPHKKEIVPDSTVTDTVVTRDKWIRIPGTKIIIAPK